MSQEQKNSVRRGQILHRFIKEKHVGNDGGMDLELILNDAKAAFPVKFEYDAWEIPETNKQKENMICEILNWYQRQFGVPSLSSKEKVSQ